MPTVLVSIDPKTKMCNRYDGKRLTDSYVVETDITPVKVALMRDFPTDTGEPVGDKSVE